MIQCCNAYSLDTTATSCPTNDVLFVSEVLEPFTAEIHFLACPPTFRICRSGTTDVPEYAAKRAQMFAQKMRPTVILNPDPLW